MFAVENRLCAGSERLRLGRAEYFSSAGGGTHPASGRRKTAIPTAEKDLMDGMFLGKLAALYEQDL